MISTSETPSSSSPNSATVVKNYLGVYLILMILLVVTVVAAHLSLGQGATLVAMTIAAVKGALVMIFFMHLRESPRLTWVAATSALVWLVILVVGVLADYVAREFAL